MSWKKNKNSRKFCGTYIKTMETYCVSCKKYTENKNWNVRKTKQNTLFSYQIVLSLVRKIQLLLKIKNSTILINLKWKNR